MGCVFSLTLSDSEDRTNNGMVSGQLAVPASFRSRDSATTINCSIPDPRKS